MRVRFSAGQAGLFIDNVQHVTRCGSGELAKLVGVSARTLRDWRCGRWQMSEQSLDRLCELAQLPRPDGITILPEYWSVHKAARRGAQRRYELHGNPATAEGRRRGGMTAQARFRLQPEYFRAKGVVVRKPIIKPPLSADLAELMGILLGDGGITSAFVAVSCNCRLESQYANFVTALITRLFHVRPFQVVSPACNGLAVVTASVELVDHLETLGLKRGNKVAQQVDVPAWIWEQRDYRIACLRGLIDTDGSIYRHAYKVAGALYAYPKLCFTNHSRPLLQSAKKLFESLNLFPTIHKDGRHLYLHDTRAVKSYFELVGTHNPRYQQRFREFSLVVGRQGVAGEVRERLNRAHC